MKKIFLSLAVSTMGVAAVLAAEPGAAPGAPGAPGAGGAVTPEQVIANNDANKDGVVTKDEATKAGRNLAQMWDTFDANKDGKVDLDEVKKGLAATQGGGAPGGAPAPAAPAAPPAAR